MADLETDRLVLHPADVALARRIMLRSPSPTDVWASDFPFEGDVVSAMGFLGVTETFGDPGPFGHYVISLRRDGRAVGGIGFKGRPERGVVEIGYGLAPSARGHGYAAEAVVVLLGVAETHGATRVVADAEPDNLASQRTLLRAGFRRVDDDGPLHVYEAFLDAGPAAT